MARGAVSELTVPLRAAWNVPRNKRASRAVSEVRNQVQKHLNLISLFHLTQSLE